MYNVIIKQHILAWTKKEILYILFCFPKHGISWYLLQVSRSYNIIEDPYHYHYCQSDTHTSETKQNKTTCTHTHTHIILLYVCTLGSFAHIPSWLAVVIIRFLVLIIAITYQWTIWSTIIHHSQVNIPNTHTLTCTRTSMVQTVNFWPWKVS